VDANTMLAGKYLNASDLKGRPVRVTIASVTEARFRDGTSKLVLSFEGARKQLALNKTNLRAVIAVLGTYQTEQWIGQRLTLQPEKVEFGGQLVDGLRVAAPPAQPRLAPPPPPRQAPPPPDPDEFHATDDDVPF
jgi:hypothetical protein